MAKRLDVRLCDLRDRHALSRQPVRKQGERCCVVRGLRHHMIAGAHMGNDRRRNRRHAGADRDRALGSFQLRNKRFDLRYIGRAVAGVEALRMPACRNLGAQFRRRENVGRALVNRGGDRFAARRRGDARML